MPGAGVVGPLLVFCALAIVMALVLRRVTIVAGGFRQEVQSRHQISDVVRRADLSLTELAGLIDEVRRRKTTPEVAAPSLTASGEALRQYTLEVAAVQPSAGQAPVRDALIEDLARAERAVDLIEHGCLLLASGSAEQHGQGETSVKRGYLNLLHAREAIRGRHEQIAAVAVTPATGLVWRRRSH